MSKSEDQILLIFKNKNLPESKPIFCYVKPTVDMFSLKDSLINFFHKDTKPKITDFRLVREGPSDDDQNDTLENNFFDEKYNSKDAFTLMNQFKGKTTYFRTIKLSIEVDVIDRTKTTKLSFLISYKRINILEQIESAMNIKIDKLYHFFQKKTYDEVSDQDDMRKYSETGLILYLFPIQAEFIYTVNNNKAKILLKIDKPLNDYLQETISKKLKITSTNLLLRIKGKGGFSDVKADVPVHQILKKQAEEPVVFEIIDTTPNKIAILIPLESGKDVKINFEYKSENMKIENLIKTIKEYFGIKSAKVQLLCDDDIIDKSKPVKPYSSKNQTLTLKCDQLNDLSIERIFKIKNKVISKAIQLDSTVLSIIKDFANEYGSDKSLISIILDNTTMNRNILFANYFIPPEKEIIVDIKDFTKFVNLKVYGSSSGSDIQFKVGFTPKMKIKSLRKSSEFQEKIPKNLQSNLFFFFDDDKLAESLTFESYEFEGDETIKVCVAKCYIFKNKDKMVLVRGDKKIDELREMLQDRFDLTSDQFLFEQGGKILPENASTSKYPNGTIFELKIPAQIKFLIDGKNEITVNSSEKVKCIISKLAAKTHSKENDIQLLNDENVLLNPDTCIFSLFEDKGKNHKYELKSVKAKKFTFQTQSGKYIMESLIPSMTIGEALAELRKRGKKIEEDAFIVYMGQVVDNKATLLSLYGSKGCDEADEAEPFLIETDIPEQIEVELKFQAGKLKSKKNNKFNFIKGTTAYNVRYLASILSDLDVDSISLEEGDQILNDEDELEEDVLITVDLTQAIQETKKTSKDVQQILSTTQKRATEKEKAEKAAKEADDMNVTTKMVRGRKVESDSTDDDYLEYNNEEEEEEEDVLEKGNGIIKKSDTNPDNEYLFKFKIIKGREFSLSLPKDVTVKEVKEKIAEDEGFSTDDITIFIGNQRLADFNKLACLSIPKKVSFFTVKIIDLKNTLICTRVKL